MAYCLIILHLNSLVYPARTCESVSHALPIRWLLAHASQLPGGVISIVLSVSWPGFQVIDRFHVLYIRVALAPRISLCKSAQFFSVILFSKHFLLPYLYHHFFLSTLVVTLNQFIVQHWTVLVSLQLALVAQPKSITCTNAFYVAKEADTKQHHQGRCAWTLPTARRNLHIHAVPSQAGHRI